MKFNIFVVLIAAVLNVGLATDQTELEATQIQKTLDSTNTQKSFTASFEDCFNAFTNSMDSQTKSLTDKVNSCFKETEEKKFQKLEKFEILRSENINKTEVIGQEFTECSNKINIDEYTTCIENLVKYNNRILEDIAVQEKGFSENVIEPEIEENCVSSSLGNTKLDTLAIFDKFYECMTINPYEYQ